MKLIFSFQFFSNNPSAEKLKRRPQVHKTLFQADKLHESEGYTLTKRNLFRSRTVAKKTGLFHNY